METLPFEQWARAKYNEIAKQINPCDEKGNLDPQRLNEVLTKFSQHFAWAITIQEVEANKLSIMVHQYDGWYKERYNLAFRSLREADAVGRGPAQSTIEAQVVQVNGEQILIRQQALENQRSRVDLLKGFVKVLEKQASILQTISSNMRSELFYAGGIKFDGKQAVGNRVNNATKELLHSALTGQKAEGSE